MGDEIELSTAPATQEPLLLLLHPRRETFEHGLLLPLSNLVFSGGTQNLAPLKAKLLCAASSPPLIDALAVSKTLEIALDHALLILETLAAVLPSDSDQPAAANRNDEISADVDDLILFFYLQSYRRLLPRPQSHKDSASVADVMPMPSTSAFDECLSLLSSTQLVHSNGRRVAPSEAEEEAYQLSYLKKHLANIIALLAEPAGGEDEQSLVLTSEKFERLGFLIQFCENGSEVVPLSQAATFFANSDPVMPPVPFPAAQVLYWLLQNIGTSLVHIAKKVSTKESAPSRAFDLDVATDDANTSHLEGQNSSPPSRTPSNSNAAYSRSQTFVEGFSKACIVKQACDIKGCSVKILNCHDSMIYILAPLGYATVYGCSDATIVLGAIGKSVRVDHCERVQLIAAAKRISISNCRECVFFLGINQRPVLLGDNHMLQVAPHNTFYSQLAEHVNQVGIDCTVNRWDEPLAMGMVDPHGSLSCFARASDVEAPSATCLDPSRFTNFLIPNWLGGESTQSEKHNPFPLPEIYKSAQMKNNLVSKEIKQALRDAPLDENQKREIVSALHVHFKDWLYASGNIRQLYCLRRD
ncbi:hypothetical protein AAC387_Pa05g2134 [Persea americana]